MELRPITTATVSLGLVVIPVKLFGATESSRAVRFHQVHRPCGTRVKYRYYCPTDDRLVERDEIDKGYEFSKGRFVLFSEEELSALNAESTDVIEIAEFVPAGEVDPLYFERSYFLGPDKGGGRPYHLLAAAMDRTRRVALARYAARGKNYLVMLRALEGGLVMHRLRFADQLRRLADVPIDEAPELPAAELDLAIQLIESRAAETFHPETYEDEVRNKLWGLVESKIQGDEIVGAPEAVPQAHIVDLMEALKASLAGSGHPAGDDAVAGPAAGRKAS